MSGDHEHYELDTLEEDVRNLDANLTDLLEVIPILVAKLGLTIDHDWRDGCCKEPRLLHA